MKPGSPEGGTLGAQTLRGISLTGAAQLFRMVLQLLSLVLLTRLLLPEDFGLVAAVWPVLAFALIIQDFGLYQAVLQRAEMPRELRDDVFWLALAIAVVCAILIAASAPWIASAYGEPRLSAIVTALTTVMLFGGLACVPLAMLARQLRFGVLALVDIIAALCGLLVAVALAAFGAGYWAIVAGPMTTAGATALLAWRFERFRPGAPALRLPGGGIMKFGANLGAYSMTVFLARNADVVLAASVGGFQAAGYYDRASKLLLVPLQSLSAPLGRVMVAVLSRLQTDLPRLRAAYLRAFALLALVAVPGIGAAVASSTEVILLLFGPRWEGVAPLFAWLGAAGLAMLPNQSVNWLLTATARTPELLRLGVIAAIASLVAFGLGIWLGGLVGLTMAYAAAQHLVVAPVLWSALNRAGLASWRELLERQLPLLGAVLLLVLVMPAAKEATGASGVMAIMQAVLMSYALAVLALLTLPTGRVTLRDAMNLARSGLSAVLARASKSRRAG